MSDLLEQKYAAFKKYPLRKGKEKRKRTASMYRRRRTVGCANISK